MQLTLPLKYHSDFWQNSEYRLPFLQFVHSSSHGYGQRIPVRGFRQKQDAYVKCMQFVKSLEDEDKRFVVRNLGRILTKSEVEAVLAGHDIIISGEDINKRLRRE